MLMSKDRMPASNDAETTAIQFTSDISTAVPMVAIAVCAIVRIARIPAAINHSFVNTFFMRSLLPVYVNKKSDPMSLLLCMFDIIFYSVDYSTVIL